MSCNDKILKKSTNKNQNRLKTEYKRRISVQIKFFMSLLLAYLSTKWYNLTD